jgi:prepilin-type N-terminal cleavage/methylation domain-containing protein
MIKANRAGFTIVEILVVAILAAVIMAATYQSLISQERTHRATGEMIRGQDAIRAALGILEAELREAATLGDVSVIGVRDLVAASQDSVTVRAQRKIGFVCSVHPSDRRLVLWPLATRDRFRQGDGLLIFAERDPTTAADDQWLPGRATQVQDATEVCALRPLGSTTTPQRVDVGGLDGSSIGGGYLDGVLAGSPVRGFDRATYRLFAADGGWFLGRRGAAGGAPDTLVTGLAAPGQGLVFQYLNAAGNTITDDPVPLEQVAGVRITARTNPREGSGASAVTVHSTIYFRNN